ASKGDEEQVVAVREATLLSGSTLRHALLPAWLYEPLPEGLQRLLGCQYGEKIIRHEYLPFDVEVVRYFKNSKLPRRVRPDDDNPATAGTGKDFLVEERKTGTGTG